MKNALNQFLFGGSGTSSALGDVGLLIARLMFGINLAVLHGWGKIYRDGSFGPPPERFVRGVEDLGFPAPTLFAWSAALAEFVGAMLVAAGLLTRPAAMMVVVTMAVAAFGQHAADPWAVRELALLYLGGFALFVFVGAGRYSLERTVQSAAVNVTEGNIRARQLTTNLEFWGALGLILFFFMPWISFLGAGLAGYQIGDVLRQTNAEQHLALFIYLVPVIAAICLIAEFSDQRRVAFAVYIIAGLMPFFVLVYSLYHVGSDLFELMSIGAWLTLLAGTACLIGSIRSGIKFNR